MSFWMFSSVVVMIGRAGLVLEKDMEVLMLPVFSSVCK